MRYIKQPLAVFLNLALSALLFGLLSNVKSQAQSTTPDGGPSLKETEQWLADNLMVQHSYKFKDVVNDMEEVRFEGCRMTAVMRFAMKNPYYANNKETVDVNLGDFDPVSSKVDYAPENKGWPESFLVSLYTTNSLPKIKVTHVKYKDKKFAKPREPEMKTMNILQFYVQDREMGKRIVKAFKRAIQLCGGKVDPF